MSGLSLSLDFFSFFYLFFGATFFSPGGDTTEFVVVVPFFLLTRLFIAALRPVGTGAALPGITSLPIPLIPPGVLLDWSIWF